MLGEKTELVRSFLHSEYGKAMNYFANNLPEWYKPMLAAKTNDEILQKILQDGKTTLRGSPKVDGIRCTVAGGKAYSRTRKLLPNPYIQEAVASGLYDGLDGELTVGPVNAYNVYNVTNSYVMTKYPEYKDGGLRFHVFDDINLAKQGLTFSERLERIPNYNDGFAIPLQHDVISSYSELRELETAALEDGFEGYMVRRAAGTIKFGRSTERELLLMKLKRDEDAELPVIGFEEAMVNENEAFINELGRTTRSSNQENLRPAGRVGAFLVMWDDKLLRVATGKFTHKELEHIWNHRSDFLGRLLKFVYFPHGMKDLPRHPRALGWRDPMDT